MKRSEFRQRYGGLPKETLDRYPELRQQGWQEAMSAATLVDIRCGGPRHRDRRLVGAVLGFRGQAELIRMQPRGRLPAWEKRGQRYFAQDTEVPADERYISSVLYCDRCGRLEEVTPAQVELWADEARQAGKRLDRVIHPAGHQG